MESQSGRELFETRPGRQSPRGWFAAIEQHCVVQMACTGNVSLGKMLRLAEINETKTAVTQPVLELGGADYHGRVIHGGSHWAGLGACIIRRAVIVLVLPSGGVLSIEGVPGFVKAG